MPSLAEVYATRHVITVADTPATCPPHAWGMRLSGEWRCMVCGQVMPPEKAANTLRAKSFANPGRHERVELSIADGRPLCAGEPRNKNRTAPERAPKHEYRHVYPLKTAKGTVYVVRVPYRDGDGKDHTAYGGRFANIEDAARKAGEVAAGVLGERAQMNEVGE